jgi:hypothetical protein
LTKKSCRCSVRTRRFRDYNPIITKYAIDHQEAAGTVLKGTAMSVVSVIVNNKILKVPFVFQD